MIFVVSSVPHGTTARDIRLRDWLICGLREPGMISRVLEEHYDSNLSLARVLQICSAYEGSRETGKEVAPSSLSAIARSTYKRSRAAGTSVPKVGNPTTVCPYCRGRTTPARRLQGIWQEMPTVPENRTLCKGMPAANRLCRAGDRPSTQFR